MRNFPIVFVGASVGGLEAYIRLLKNIPANPGVAIVIVNYFRNMPTQLHEILPRYTTMPTAETGYKPTVDNSSDSCHSNFLSVLSSHMRPINLRTSAPKRIARTVQSTWLNALDRMLEAISSAPGWLSYMVPAGMEAI